MADPALDQFSQALFWKLAPWMVLLGGGGILLKGVVRWLERRAVRLGRDIRARTAPPRVVMPRASRQAHDPNAAPTLDTINWENFELLAAEIFRRQGFEVEVSSGLGADGGKDVTLRRNGETRLVQCKNLRAGNKVGVEAMRAFYGLIVSESASGGIFITTGGYSRDAIEFTAGKAIELVGRAELERLIASVSRPGENLCDVASWIEDFAATASVAHPNCPRCRTTMKLRRGPTGRPFWGCGSFPRCKATRDARLEVVRARAFRPI